MIGIHLAEILFCWLGGTFPHPNDSYISYPTPWKPKKNARKVFLKTFWWTMMFHMTLLQDGSVFLQPKRGIEALNQKQLNPNRKDAKLCLSIYIYVFFSWFSHLNFHAWRIFQRHPPTTPGRYTWFFIHEKATCSTGRSSLFPRCISSQNWGNWGIVINFNVSHDVGMTIPQYYS